MATDIEQVKKAYSKMDKEFWENKYHEFKVAIMEFETNKTIEAELKKARLEKEYYVDQEKYEGYEKIIKGDDPEEVTKKVKEEIDKLEAQYDYLKRKYLEVGE